MDSASSTSSNSNNSNFLTTTTNTSGNSISDTTTSSGLQQQHQSTELEQQQQQQQIKNDNNFIEQLIQQNHLILTNNNNKFTLNRSNQMFDQQQHNIMPQSPKTINKYLTNRFGTINHHAHLNLSQHQQQYIDLNGQMPNPPVLPAPTMATTAYLVQTANGSALLIPPQTPLNPTNHFIQTNSSSGNNQQANTFSLNRNPYNLTTIPLQNNNNNNNNTLLNTTSTTTLPNSISITNQFNRPDSTASTNVYQTIDTEKNGYLYPLENFYDTSTFNNNNNNNNANNMIGTNRNSKRRNFHQQQFQMNPTHHHHQQQHQQQQGQFAKLLESNQANNGNGTLHSNTNSNFFASPALSSATSNRRLANSSFFERFKYRLSKKLKAYCSWKCLAMLFLFITLNLFMFTIYLSIMRMYNLNWHLKENTQLSLKHQSTLDTKRQILFYNIGDTIEDQIMPFESFYLQFHAYNSKHIKFNLTINKNSHVGIYMEKSVPPTFTKFKYFETFDANSLVNKNEANNNRVNTAFVHYFDQGLWYINVLNDNKQPLKFRLYTEHNENIDNSNCPISCFGKGECVNGVCKCFTGFTGLDCSESMCPVLCNGHGKYENGKCLCDFNYHGIECELTTEQCESFNCNGNGECVKGKCECKPGYQGDACEKLTCHSPNCSNHGVCLDDGKCHCFTNFTGSDCSQRQTFNTLSICSNHGDFDYTTKSCACHKGYSGADCSRNENCLDRLCSSCKNGWSGINCLVKAPFQCDLRCSEHGICVNGTCTCSPGYQGRNCDINNCPNNCNSNGVCERSTNINNNNNNNQYYSNNKYHCVCNQGWTGRACDISIEMVCNDDKDNDRDGLTDCMDPECCVFESCKLSLACNTSPEPKDRLLRKQPPSLSATFFEKMRFLIEDGSVQSFANTNTFSESQVSVIRGQVLFKNGQPLIGVKVSAVSNPAFGYTLTRNNGIFDIMVNGGGSVLLEFSRNQLKTRVVSVVAVWNQFVYIDPVTLYLSTDNEEIVDNNDKKQLTKCKHILHNSTLIYPIVKTSWKEIRTYYYDNSIILPDSGVVRSELNIMETTNLKLVYSSNQASGYSSTIFILLTPANSIPEQLQQIHLQITVEGVLHKQTFDAYSDLRYEYSWDRRNAYEQRVYGLAYAKVMIGYQYEHCSFIYWQTSVVKLAGYDLGSSEIGNWNIDIHHRLNTLQGILHKGDGTTIYLKEIQKQIEIVDKNSFHGTPSSLSINRDGIVFVGDSKYVWMLNNSEPAKKLVELKMNQAYYKYYLTNEPITGQLMISDPIKRELLAVKSLEQINDIKSNYNNNYFDKSNLDLTYPKSFAYDSNGVLYFIDGNKIKSLNNNQVVILNNNNKNVYKPMGCNTSYSLSDMQFYWPTVLVVNPIDDSVYVLDENVIYKISSFNTVELVIGQPFGCNSGNGNSFQALTKPIDMAFNSDGDLFILENDNNKVKQILILKSNGGDLELFYDNNNNNNNKIESDHQSNFLFNGFNDPISIAVHQNKSVYVLDRGDNCLYHIKNSILKDDFSGKYTIVSPETREAYVFNRFGLHLNTIDLMTGLTLFNFTYNGNALYGKLTSITDQNKVLLSIKRDFHGRAEYIQTTNSFNIKLKLNNFDMLRSLTTNNDNRSYNFNYLGNTGLLTSRTELNDKITLFNYEKNGKLKEIIESNSMITNITYFINSSGIVTVMSKSDLNIETWITNGSSTYIYKNGKLETLMESNKYNLNIRALTSEDSFNAYKSYFKSILNFKPFTNRMNKVDDLNNKRKYKNSN